MKARVEVMKNRQFVYNGQGLRGDGHFKLAGRVAVYHETKCIRGSTFRVYKRPFSVAIAWCGVDGSLLQPMKLHRAEAWRELEADLTPLLRDIKRARMQAGYSVDDPMPVFHATDTYGRHRRCIRKCYAAVWSEMRQKVLSLTPRSNSYGVEWQSPEESNLGVAVYGHG